MLLPQPRGPVSTELIKFLSGSPRPGPAQLRLEPTADPVTDEDLQVSLFICYELHYRGFDGVDERWEWYPDLLTLRAVLESVFENDLRQRVTVPVLPDPAQLPKTLTALVDGDQGPPLSGYLHRSATYPQFEEFVMHRSVYHLREADPHSFGIPRLDGRVKAALVEIQADEYGGGQADRMHAELFRTTMDRLGLRTTYGSYVDTAPAVTLATNNLMSLFALHRRLRGALLGHLAVLEVTSSLPNRRYGNGLRRLGADDTATRFYDEHVEADAVHEQIAVHDLCGVFAMTEPDRAEDILFGAAACLTLENLFAAHLLAAWERGDSSLHPTAALPVSGGAR
jgi:hypothetical protein